MQKSTLIPEEKELQDLITPEYIKNNRLTDSEMKKRKEELKSYSVQKAEKKAISIRLLSSDILKLKAKAESMGIPYQTLIALELHKLAN